MKDHINTVLTEEEFLNKVFRKSKSQYSVDLVKAILVKMDNFTQDVYKKPRLEKLGELAKNYKRSQDPGQTLSFFDKFCEWLGEDHPDIETINKHTKVKTTVKAKGGSSIKTYLQYAKKWLEIHGLKIL